MKKILFASTALVAAGVLGSGSASASDKINLQLGGFSKWWVVGEWQSGDYENATRTANANVNVKGDNEIWFGGSTTLDNGIKVGVDVHLEAGGHSDMTTDTIDKSYVYIEGGFGKFLVGTQKNGTYLLHVNAPDAAGNWGESGILSGGYSIWSPAAVHRMAGGNTTAINTTNNSEAITYVAPTFYGLTVGASYLPHGGIEDRRSSPDLNHLSLNLNTDGGDVQQVYGAGALYANEFAGVGVKVSAGIVQAKFSGGQFGSTGGGLAGDWLEEAYGTQITYAGFTLGGSYRNQRENNIGTTTVDMGSLGNITSQPGSTGNGQAWDAGLKYAAGPYAVSFTYFHSGVQHDSLVGGNDGHDKINVYQVSGKYNLGPGVDVLASAGYMEANSALASSANGDADHNSGWVVMSGLSLTF